MFRKETDSLAWLGVRCRVCVGGCLVGAKERLSMDILLLSRRLTLRLSRNVGKSKSFQEQRRRKIEKWEAQVKDLQEGGSQDSDPSRRAKLKGRIEGSLKGM